MNNINDETLINYFFKNYNIDYLSALDMFVLYNPLSNKQIFIALSPGIIDYNRKNCYVNKVNENNMIIILFNISFLYTIHRNKILNNIIKTF